MRRIFAFLMMSLDGFVEDRDHALGWHSVDDEFHAWANRQLESAGALLFGRRTYEFMADAWTSPQLQAALPETARLMNAHAKIVVSRHAYRPAWGRAQAVGAADLHRELAALKAQNGGDILALGSNDLLAAVVDCGMLDELRLMLAPVALGGGTPLLTGLERPPRLGLVEARPFRNGNVLLRYNVGTSLAS